MVGTVQHVAMWRRAERADPARGCGSQQEGTADPAGVRGSPPGAPADPIGAGGSGAAAKKSAGDEVDEPRTSPCCHHGSTG